MTLDTNNIESLLRIQQVKARTGLSRTTIYKYIGQGKFPKAIHVQDSRMSSWPSSDIDEWIAEQKKSSRNIPAFDSIHELADQPTPAPRKRNPRGDKPVKA